MRQVIIGALNISLVALCSYQGAKVANIVAAQSLQPAYTYELPAPVESQQSRSGWEARKTILDRNLFGAKILDDAQPEPERIVEESVEETKLPLVLEATVASPNSSASWAAVHDKRSRETMLLRVGEEIEGHARVSVAAIERRRILLKNSGRHEELLLNDEEPASPTTVAATAATSVTGQPRNARRARRPSGRGVSTQIEALRREQVQNSQDELTLQEITEEIERLRELEEN